MTETNFEDKCPMLKCSICNFEVKSVPSMENHISTAHGLKLKLEIIDSNDTKTPVPEVAQTESGKTLSQINDLGALNNENQIAKSNHPASAHTEMEAKNEKSIGLLRSFRMNKQDDDIQISSMKLEQESDVMRNDIERKEKTLEEIMFPNFDEEESANFDISRSEMNTVQLHRTQGTVGNENVTNASQTGKDKLTSHPGRDHKVSTILTHSVDDLPCVPDDIVSAKDIRQRYQAEVGFKTENPCAPDDEDINTPYQCDSCNKTIKGSVMLQAHQYQEHHQNPNIGLLGDVGDKHACRVCLKLFTRKHDVKVHILGVHCGDRRYPCTMCSKRFKESTHLRKHLSTHTGKFLTILFFLRQRTLFQIVRLHNTV